MGRQITDENWLEVTMNALEELRMCFKHELEYGQSEELQGKLEELEALTAYLNKTN